MAQLRPRFAVRKISSASAAVSEAALRCSATVEPVLGYVKMAQRDEHAASHDRRWALSTRQTKTIMMSRGDAMRRVLAGLLLAVSFDASSAQANSLTLKCSGTLMTTDVSKENDVSGPKNENIVDLSVVVDLDQRSVSGLLRQTDGVHSPIPIVAIDTNSVKFHGSINEPLLDKSIVGTVDGITGKIDAFETQRWRGGTLRNMTWDLRCKITKPLF